MAVAMVVSMEAAVVVSRCFRMTGVMRFVRVPTTAN